MPAIMDYVSGMNSSIFGAISAVTAEFEPTDTWVQLSDEMMETYTPSVCRPGVAAYVRKMAMLDEAAALRWIRGETYKRFSVEEASMLIFPEQGKWLSQLVVLLNASRVLELGTFTGYSSTSMALALPPHGHLMCADLSTSYTSVAREAWVRGLIYLDPSRALRTVFYFRLLFLVGFSFCFSQRKKYLYFLLFCFLRRPEMLMH